jgi:hypothetical protein
MELPELVAGCCYMQWEALITLWSLAAATIAAFGVAAVIIIH